MKTEGLEEEIKKIIEVVEKLPEKYQMKSFEVLLTSFIGGHGVQPLSDKTKIPEENKPEDITPFILPIDVKAFFQQYTIPEEAIPKIFFIHNSEVRAAYKLNTTKKAAAQIQVALLIALENAIKKTPSKFEFSMEEVRQRCIDQKCYDGANFKSIFKKNGGLFKDLKDEEHITLSPDGKEELAETISAVTNYAKGKPD